MGLLDAKIDTFSSWAKTILQKLKKHHKLKEYGAIRRVVVRWHIY